MVIFFYRSTELLIVSKSQSFVKGLVEELTSLDLSESPQVCITFCYFSTSYIYQIVYGWNACLLSCHLLRNYLCKCCLHLQFEWKIKDSIKFSPSKSSGFYDRVLDTSLLNVWLYVFIILWNCWFCRFLLHITGGWKTFVIS